jgi:hypothetical protein
MSAPNRTQARPPQPSEAPVSFQRKVLGYAGAKAAFERLSNSGFPEDLLWRWLWGLAQSKRSFTTARKRAPRKWYALPTFPPHKLRRFPDRVRGLAEEIKSLNEAIQSDGVYRAARELLRDAAKGIAGASPDSMRAELYKLDKLPALLRSYADSIAATDRLVAYCAPKAPARFEAVVEPKLAEAVRKLTGKPHFEEVSSLLTAAYSAVGCEESLDTKVLQMRHSRRRSRKK